jgi:hypothetical protein
MLTSHDVLDLLATVRERHNTPHILIATDWRHFLPIPRPILQLTSVLTFDPRERMHQYTERRLICNGVGQGLGVLLSDADDLPWIASPGWPGFLAQVRLTELDGATARFLVTDWAPLWVPLR